MVDEKLKMAIISGAAQALKIKETNPKKFDHEIMQEITNNVEKIAEKIDIGDDTLF